MPLAASTTPEIVTMQNLRRITGLVLFCRRARTAAEFRSLACDDSAE